MFRNRILKLLSSLFLLVVLCTGQIAAVPYNDVAPAGQSEMSLPSSQLLKFNSGGHTLGFTSHGMYAATGSHALGVDFVGAGQVEPQSDSPVASDGKPGLLAQVLYSDLWDGITLQYSANAGGIYTTTYTIAPTANPKDIRLRYNAPLKLNDDGTLGIQFNTETLTESAPLAWQDIQGKRVAVDVSFQVDGREVSFNLGNYNPSYSLTIDPSLSWSTFLGGKGYDFSNDIFVDDLGYIYVAGTSWAYYIDSEGRFTNPKWGTPKHAFGGGEGDAFVAKLDPYGNLIWNTFLGGTERDDAIGLAGDGNGNIYVIGLSFTSWENPIQAFQNAGPENFLAKLNSDGILSWNTFLGTTGIGGIDVGPDGNIFLSGSSEFDWIVSSPAINPHSGNLDGFVVKMTPSGSLEWHTFMGGGAGDHATAIAADEYGNIYIIGGSEAGWGNPVLPYTDLATAFIAKLNSSGDLVWNTFFGYVTSVGSIAVDGEHNVYATGTSINTWGNPILPYDPGHRYPYNKAFVAKFDMNGALVWNTFLGDIQENGDDIGVDNNGFVHVVGTGTGNWGDPFRAFSGYVDIFVATLDESGNLQSNGFLGGEKGDYGAFAYVTGSGNVFVAGSSEGWWGNPIRPFGYSLTGLLESDSSIARLSMFDPKVLSIKSAGTSPTKSSSIQFTVSFSEPVRGVDKTDFVVVTTGGTNKASVSKVSGSGSAYTVTVNTGSGSGTIQLRLVDNGSIQSLWHNPLGGAGAGNGDFDSGDIYTIDKTKPTVLSITRLDASPTELASVNFLVTFSEPVTGVDIKDFKLVGTGSLAKSKPVITSVSGSETTYTVTATTGISTAPGTLRLDLMANKTIKDTALNLLTASFKTGLPYVVDRAPVVVSIVRSSSNPTNLPAVKFTVKFSEAVTGVDAGDFEVISVNLALPGNPIVSITGIGITWVIIVNTGTGTGTLGLNLVDDNSIVDSSGYKLGGDGPDNGNFAGQVYNVR